MLEGKGLGFELMVFRLGIPIKVFCKMRGTGFRVWGLGWFRVRVIVIIWMVHWGPRMFSYHKNPNAIPWNVLFYIPLLPIATSRTKTRRVPVGMWCILRAQRHSCILTSRPKYIPYSYMDSSGEEPSISTERSSVGICFESSSVRARE